MTLLGKIVDDVPPKQLGYVSGVRMFEVVPVAATCIKYEVLVAYKISIGKCN